MFVKTLGLVFILLSSFAIRYLRWLAWFQQKEYRMDRLWLFVKTKEGLAELLRLIPKRSDFSRTSLKRPKPTPRATLTGFLSILLMILVLTLPWARGWWRWLFLIVLIYVFLPVFFLLINLLLESVKYFLTRYWLFRASLLIAKHRPIIIGITGSYGKTSSKLLLAHVLKQKYSVFVTPKSYNTKLSVAQSVLTGYRGQRLMVIEYGAYTRGEIATLAKFIPPNVAVITGLTQQHLGLFGSMENIAKAKAELIAALPDGAKVFINSADSGADQIFMSGKSKHHAGESLKRINYANFSQSQNYKLSVGENGFLQIKMNNKIVKTQLVGQQYLSQVSLCFAVGEYFGLELDVILDALRNFSPTENFIRRYSLASGCAVIDDGVSSNPTGFRAVLKLVSSFKFERKILVTAGIVDLGKMSAQIHLKLASLAAQTLGEVWYVGEAGKEEFRTVFGSRLIEKQAEVVERLKQLSADDLLIIEGLIPKWLKMTLAVK